MKALITGGSRGIGRAIALELANLGYEIWINYKSTDKNAREVYDAVLECGVNARLVKFDVGNRQEVRKLLIPLLEKEGYIDVLVNNASIIRDTTFLCMKDKDWDDVIDTSLGGFYNVTKAVLPGMVRERKGRIISITFLSASVGMRGQSNYSAGKAAIVAASKSLAKEVARQNILVNCIAPEIIETDMISDTPNLEKRKKEISLRGFAKANDIAKTVAFLCSNNANYITGSVFNVNGALLE